MLDINPEIVHFSGHGTSEGALCFENKLGETHPVHPEALASLFEQFSSNVKCVILNACYSVVQAEAIARHIPFVIGMSQAIGDKAAIAFSIGFYQALGAGRSIEEAYKLGCVQIRLENIPEHLTPIIIRKTDDIEHSALASPYTLRQHIEQVLTNVPHELQLDGPTGGRQPRSSLVASSIMKAGQVEDFKRKRAIFEEAVLQDSSDPVGYRLLAWALQKLTDYPSAIRYDWQAIALDKSYPCVMLKGVAFGSTIWEAW